MSERDERLKNEQSSAQRHTLVHLKLVQETIHVYPPPQNDAHVVVGGVGKRQEDRNNEKYGLDLQREITIIHEWWNVNTYS